MLLLIEYEVQPGKSIYLCSAEDLIIHKAVAGRPQDISDIRGVIYRQGDKLNITTIRTWLGQSRATRARSASGVPAPRRAG